MKRVILVAVFILPLVLELGCCERCRQRRQRAVPSVAPPAPAQLPPIHVPTGQTGQIQLTGATVPATGKVFAITPQNSKIEFIGSNRHKSHRGSFKLFGGRIELPGDDLNTARLAIEVDMNSVSTDIFLLTKHLKSSDFFDVSNHPKASFVSTAIRPAQNKDVSHILAGRFTLHGITRDIEVPARIALTADAVALDCNFVIKLSDYGMADAVKKANDEVPITVSIRAARSQ